MVDASRAAEGKELAWWLRRGWQVERGWKEARYVAAGRVVAVPRDFFGHYDLLGLWRAGTGPATHMVGVQVSLSGLRKSRMSHGPPLFDRKVEGTVETFAEAPGRYPKGFYEVLTSYGPDGASREWWQVGPRRPKKGGLDLFLS